MKFPPSRILWLILPLLISNVGFAASESELLFVRRIAPLLREKCVACHGGDEENIEGGLDLRSREGLLKAGDSAAVSVTPGKSNESPLYLAVTREHDVWSAMPPKEAERLSPEQIEWIKSWIDNGAPWPDSEAIAEIAKANTNRWSSEDGVPVTTSGGLSPDWTDRKYKLDGLWAYQKVAKPKILAAQNPIDALVDARMPHGLQVAPPTDRVTLLRRATLDLTGLPPTLESVQEFVNDRSSDEIAFATVVDRLLESPHYGERMAQHWLDVARYADSSGFANDYERGNAWRYRDYVIRSFNDDKPYNQFVIEQIAGDELASQDPEATIATGFLRMGPWELTGMEVAKVARQRFLDDVVNSVGETFLAHSLQCARCHDHKFDPIPTRDYYAIQAVFATTQLAERSVPFLPSENIQGFEEREFIGKRQEEHLDTVEKLDEQLVRNAEQWFKENGKDPTEWNSAVEKARKFPRENKRRKYADLFSTARSEMMKRGINEDDYPPKLVGFTPDQFGAERVARKGLERLKWELERYEPFALAIYNGRTPDFKSVIAPIRVPSDRMTSGELEETCILTGGDPFGSGAKVEPGVLSVIADDHAPIPDLIEGRRMAFAQWVADADNPLTTRAIVNRLWLWHFGQPIAGNPNNFGSTGKKPTHPELLDWLAGTLVDQKWSIKAIHRAIMNSETYRRSASHPDFEKLRSLDPNNSSYAVFHPRRLSAEEIRDAMLLATNELNPTMGGIPNRPEMNLEAALQPRQVMGTFAPAWVPDPKPEQRHRRSIYALKLRGLSDPMQEVFNAPTPDFSCERRESSTVTPQVFSLFNSQATHSRALALANRAASETTSDDSAITRCFQLVYLRKPASDELQSCLTHWHDIESMLGSVEPLKQHPPLEIRRDAVEENTGENFSFRETLFANQVFVSDLQPSDVSVHIRALADICLALLNSNEFVYVY
ncbi:MAG: PSD1 and planctomycete cytochrome C domain-containing protein [Pirellulaceae bacterium]|nr:PSD1 and planctomycete cytochrome C domain-containing protein [Pirellulaceae bacterium]